MSFLPLVLALWVLLVLWRATRRSGPSTAPVEGPAIPAASPTPEFEAALLAMARGDLAALRAAVKKRPEVLLERDPEQRTLLLNACLPIFRIANVDVIAALLQLGADARDVDFRGCSSLHGIVQMDTAKYPQPTDEVARLLVGKGLPVDQQDRFGNSALWRAVFDWRPGARFLAVDCLLQLGANLDLKNYHGSSPRDVLENDGKDELKKHLAAFPR